MMSFSLPWKPSTVLMSTILAPSSPNAAEKLGGGMKEGGGRGEGGEDVHVDEDEDMTVRATSLRRISHTHT